MTTDFPSVTRSDLPETTTAPPVKRASATAASRAASTVSVVSTPRARERSSALPERSHRPASAIDLGSVAAHDGRLVLFQLAKQLRAQAADADANRIEHPGLACRLGRGGRARDGFLVHGKQRAHVQIHGATCGDKRFSFVGQIDHGRRAACGKLGVRHEIDGDGVRDGSGHGVVRADVLRRLDDVFLELRLLDHVLSFATTTGALPQYGSAPVSHERCSLRQRYLDRFKGLGA